MLNAARLPPSKRLSGDRMIIRRLALFFAMLFGVAATQAPEFMQQYRQRLGGAVDELNTIVTRFNADSAGQGMSRDAGIARLRSNTDAFVAERGAQMEDIVARLQKLTRESEDFAKANGIGQLVRLTTDFDSRIAARAYESYRPAIPVTMEGFAIGLFGFFLGGALTHLLGWPFTRWARRRQLRKSQSAGDLRDHGLAGHPR